MQVQVKKFSNIAMWAMVISVVGSAQAEQRADSASQQDLPLMIVEEKRITDVSATEVKSADLAEALAKKIPAASLVRRSGIANDIILRGQKKDNINILLDDAKVYGACPNRMDPPTSHVLTNNIDAIEISEGPYDVENFGTLSGAVKIKTRMPEPNLKAEVSVNRGSWDYKKLAASLSGGSEKVRGLLSVSHETGGQYEDGEGNNFSQQIEANGVMPMANYKPEYAHIDSYNKRSLMGKLYWLSTDNQEMELSYTANRSDDVLYPSSPMDALYDDSDIVNLNYRFKQLGKFSEELEIKTYISKVEHPMSNFYRRSSGEDSANERISTLDTEGRGIKIINHSQLGNVGEIKYGLDSSVRNWDGHYVGYGTSAGITGLVSIPDVDTENRALFFEYQQTLLDQLDIKLGLRYDDTEIAPAKGSLQQNDYQTVTGFVFGQYRVNLQQRLFFGVGRGARVPDARELYFQSFMGAGALLGTPDLTETTNTELDVGWEFDNNGLALKTKLFYSQLDDFIYYNASKMNQRFENIDATLYGVDITGRYQINDVAKMDFGVAVQRGRKDQPLQGQVDKDLAEIPPLKMSAALYYQYGPRSTISAEWVAAAGWDDFDADNGEQELPGWGIVNVKMEQPLSSHIIFAMGADNLFDKTYRITNTYKDLTLLSGGAGDVMLLNEPGRYVYLNLTYAF